MNKFELVRKIENFAPLDTQESWDCSGWLVCTQNKDINKIMLALTITDDVVKQAKEKNCDMIISHHPLFYVPLAYKDTDIYCAHTNMDKAKGGTTDTLINELGFETNEIQEEFVRIVRLEKPITIFDLKEKLKKISTNLRYVNNKNVENVRTIAFCAGSGSEFINDIDADAFVTGDLKFHTALDSNKLVFDIGHFESEISVLKTMKNILGTDIVYADEKSPFLY